METLLILYLSLLCLLLILLCRWLPTVLLDEILWRLNLLLLILLCLLSILIHLVDTIVRHGVRS